MGGISRICSGLIWAILIAPAARAGEGETEFLVMGGAYTKATAKTEDGPDGLTYKGYTGRAVFTDKHVAEKSKFASRLGIYYGNTLIRDPSVADDPTVPDAMLAKSFGVEAVLGRFDFPLQFDAALGWSHAQVNLGAVDKIVRYEGLNYRFGGQVTFGESFVYFIRGEGVHHVLAPTSHPEEGASPHPYVTVKAAAVLLGVGLRS